MADAADSPAAPSVDDLAKTAADNETILAQAGAALAAAVDQATGPWIETSVASRLGRAPTATMQVDIERVTATARATEVDRLRELLALDLNQQWTNPLAVIRAMVAYPTAILTEAGVPPVDRDDHAIAMAPDDHYDLTPVSFADFGLDVHEPGLIWGAAKAHLHLQRRKSTESA